MNEGVSSGAVFEEVIDGRKYTKVNYSKQEELANCLTHGVAALAYVGCLIYLMIISVDVRTFAASLITCLSAIMVYTVSTVYHAVQDTKKKYIWRKIDHADIPFLVLGCSSSICLCLSNHVFNYIALGLCAGVGLISVVMCIKSVDKFKVFTMTFNFVIGIIMFADFLINFKLVPITAKYLYLTGALLSVTGSIIFAFKKKFVHAVFHIFVTGGTLCFYAGAVLIIQNYIPF